MAASSARGDASTHPDDDVTAAQAAYSAAFVDWFRSRSDEALRRRELAFVAMLKEAS